MWQPVEPTFTKLDIFGSESAEAPERVALRARYTASRELDNVLITSHSHRNIELGFYVVVIQCDG